MPGSHSLPGCCGQMHRRYWLGLGRSLIGTVLEPLVILEAVSVPGRHSLSGRCGQLHHRCWLVLGKPVPGSACAAPLSAALLQVCTCKNPDFTKCFWRKGQVASLFLFQHHLFLFQNPARGRPAPVGRRCFRAKRGVLGHVSPPKLCFRGALSDPKEVFWGQPGNPATRQPGPCTTSHHAIIGRGLWGRR